MADKKKQDRDGSWVEGLEGYSRQIWLAGLGAYTKMGKEGAKLFEALIKDGEEAEKAAKSEFGKKAGAEKPAGKADRGKQDPLEAARAKVDKARSKLTDKLSGLEDMLDKRVANAVDRLGVARREELQALEVRVAELTSLVEQLSSKPASAVKATRASRAPANAAKPTGGGTTSRAAKPASAPANKASSPETATKTPARRRTATVPKAATRGKNAPAPAVEAEPGIPPDQ